MEPVTHYQIDTTACDVAMQEGVQSKARSSVWMTLVLDMLTRKIVSVETHVSPLDQKTLKRRLRRLGTLRRPNNRRSS